MKKILALLAIFAFIGVVTTPATANVIDNIDKTVQIMVDDDNTIVADQDQDKKKKKKTAKATAKSGECCGSAAKAGCGEAKSGCGEAKEGCGSSCGDAKKAEKKKKTL